MSSTRRFSIITISFNSEKCITRTIESVLKQNYSDIEYIFIDGGSKDSTNKIINSYEKKLNEKGIHTIHISEPDNGISDAFNKGILKAGGEIIVILNADDELLPGSLETIDKEFTEEVDILYGNAIWDDYKNKIRKIKKAGTNLSDLLYRMIIIHPACFVKRKVYNQNGMFDDSYKYCMDKELLYRMYKLGSRFKYIDQELALMKAGGVSDLNTVKVIKEGERMAIYYGEKPLKAKLNAYYKIIRCKLIKEYKVIRKLILSYCK